MSEHFHVPRSLPPTQQDLQDHQAALDARALRIGRLIVQLYDELQAEPVMPVSSEAPAAATEAAAQAPVDRSAPELDARIVRVVRTAIARGSLGRVA